MSGSPLLQRLLFHRWRILIAVAAVAVLYVLLRPAKDPEVIIRENIHSWVQRLEKRPPDGNATQSAPRKTEAAVLLEDVGLVRRLIRDAFTEDAVVRSRGAQEQGREAITSHVYALRNQAETLRITLGEPVIQVPAPVTEIAAGDNDAANLPATVTKDTADSGGNTSASAASNTTLPAGYGEAAASSGVAVAKPSPKPVRKTDAVDAIATLAVKIEAVYKGQPYAAAYDCELRLVREKTDGKWRISELSARRATADELR